MFTFHHIGVRNHFHIYPYRLLYSRPPNMGPLPTRVARHIVAGHCPCNGSDAESSLLSRLGRIVGRFAILGPLFYSAGYICTTQVYVHLNGRLGTEFLMCIRLLNGLGSGHSCIGRFV